MKARAAKTGDNALFPCLSFSRGEYPNLRLYLMGHSFGGVLVLAAANKGGDFATLVLTQAAFSQNAFAATVADDDSRPGRFRAVAAKENIKGPIAITYTLNDEALTDYYAFASWLKGDVGAKERLLPVPDKFGAIGANGAKRIPGKVSSGVLSTEDNYTFADRTMHKVHNLNADETIKNHNDVWDNKHVADLLVKLMRSTWLDFD
jgi:pimeloyl-ACP methyl ester carboxylesterase